MRRFALALAVALAAAGCAAPAPAPVVRPAPPATAAPAAPAPAAPAAPAPATAVRDSSPSPEALAVLAGIPEPPGESRPGVVQVAPPEAFDTLRTAEPGADVPVPAPTPAMRAPTPRPEVPPPPARVPAVEPPARAAAAAPPAAARDTCWRVQLAAPAEADKGRTVREAAESLLMLPMVVEREAGRFKVRSRDCLPREAAERLRTRALDSGFKGAFLVRLPVAPQ